MMPSEFLQHSFIHTQLSHYQPFDIQALWESEGQSDSVSRLDLAGAWVTQREDHFTPVTSHSHPAWAHWKTPIRGPAFAPTACLATTAPYPHIHCVYVHFMCMLHFLFAPSLSLPCISSLSFLNPEVSFVSDLHSKRSLLTYLPTIWVWVSLWILSIATPADSLSDFLTGNRRASSGKNRDIWFVYPSSRGLSGRRPKCKSDSRGW